MKLDSHIKIWSCSKPMLSNETNWPNFLPDLGLVVKQIWNGIAKKVWKQIQFFKAYPDLEDTEFNSTLLQLAQDKFTPNADSIAGHNPYFN